MELNKCTSDTNIGNDASVLVDCLELIVVYGVKASVLLDFYISRIVFGFAVSAVTASSMA